LAYLRHLFISNEILGLQIATYQNLAFYKWLVDNAREKILSGTYRQFKDKFINEFSKFED
jgi:queuine tRNA-ribosyltransferase